MINALFPEELSAKVTVRALADFRSERKLYDVVRQLRKGLK